VINKSDIILCKLDSAVPYMDVVDVSAGLLR
jgi:hypothetical protein